MLRHVGVALMRPDKPVVTPVTSWFLVRRGTGTSGSCAIPAKRVLLSFQRPMY